MASRKPSRADLVIAFVERLKITIGDDAGKPFRLRPWQKRFIRDVYGLVVKGRRVVRRAVLSVARKNGKTELAAALVLVHLIGPEAELNGEIYSAANDREQASIVFNAVKRMIEADRGLQKRLTIVPSTKTIFVHASGLRADGSKFRALSADAGTKHGLNPSFVIYDELAQSKNRELLDTLTTSQGARAEPLFLTISTQSHDPQHPLSEMIDDGLKGQDPSTVCHLYAADDDCELLDEAQWRKANPALGDFRSLEEFRTMAAQAKRMPSFERNFRLLYLNQRVSAHASLITASDWKACRGDVAFKERSQDAETGALVEGEAIYLSLDMSTTTDLTALVAISANDGSRVRSWFWKPLDLIDDHSKRDGVRYDLYAQNGFLETSPGRTINPRLVAQKIVDLCKVYEVRALAYDRHRTDELLRYLDDVDLIAQEGSGYGLRLRPVGQGFVGFSPCVTAFETAVLDGQLVHDGHPLLTWTIMNAQAISDPAGNRKLDKAASKFRIDGAVALAMGLGVKAIDREAPVAISPWEDPNFRMATL